MKWLFLNSGAGDAAFNMALDEALLETASRRQLPVLRSYGWTQPAATFGYFQHYAEIEKATLLRPLIRRPTGGGLVPHDVDWTYSLIIPPGYEWYDLRAEESYRAMHEWLQRAFAKLNVTTEVASCCKKSLPGQCFVGHEKFDLLWHGRKIAGAAQRRNKAGLLIQGSVQPPPADLRRSDWELAMQQTAASAVEWQVFEPNGELLALAEKLAATKYSQAQYNQKR